MTLSFLGCTASLFAFEKHCEQKYGDKPYYAHLFDTVFVMKRFAEKKLSQELIDAAWLHDVVEDTTTTIDDVRETFGDYVANIVDAVSCQAAPTRKQRQQLTYPKIRETLDAITVKLSDRIANLEEALKTLILDGGNDMFSMYLKEWDTFKTELRGRCLGESSIEAEMWEHLDKLFLKGNAILAQDKESTK